MSTLWTPSGEHPIDERPSTPGGDADRQGPTTPSSARVSSGRPGGEGDDRVAADAMGDEEIDVAELRRQLAATPAEVVIANHCYGLFELAAVYLSQDPPLIPQSRIAIDALGYLVDGLGERLGEANEPLREALAQIRLGFVQVEAANRA